MGLFQDIIDGYSFWVGLIYWGIIYSIPPLNVAFIGSLIVMIVYLLRKHLQHRKENKQHKPLKKFQDLMDSDSELEDVDISIFADKKDLFSSDNSDDVSKNNDLLKLDNEDAVSADTVANKV
jgi:hypothetical protein